MPDPTTPGTGFGPNEAPLDQQALQGALDTYNQAASTYSAIQAQYDAVANNPSGDKTQLQTLSSQLDNARNQLGSASRDYSTVAARLYTSYQANQRAAKDPNEQRMWANEADKAKAQSDLYAAEADVYQAKTQADIDNGKAKAQAALQRAQTAASQAGPLNDQRAAQTALANAKLAYLPALSDSTIKLHNAQIELAGSRSTQALSAAALNDAKRTVLLPEQAAYWHSKGLLTDAEYQYYGQHQDATIADLQSKAGLNDARAQQILSSIGKWQALPYNDTNAPNLTLMQPGTGNVMGVPNPGYVNPALRPIQDQEAAIAAVQKQIADGQMTSDEGDRLIDTLRTALQFKAAGMTPEQYFQEQRSQGQMGLDTMRNMLSDAMTGGNTAANNFLTAARGVRGLSPDAISSITPYSNALNTTMGMMGGDATLQKAQQLFQQITPVTDQFSALKALAQHAQIAQQLNASPQAPQQAPAAPAPSANDVPAPQQQAVQQQDPNQMAPASRDDYRLPVPSFAGGGTVPGALGQPQLAVVHGGEQIYDPRTAMRPSSGTSIVQTRMPQAPAMPTQPGASSYVGNAQGLPPGLAMRQAQGNALPAPFQNGSTPPTQAPPPTGGMDDGAGGAGDTGGQQPADVARYRSGATDYQPIVQYPGGHTAPAGDDGTMLLQSVMRRLTGGF